MDTSKIDGFLNAIDLIGCVLDREGIILEVSTGWKRAADLNGFVLPHYAVGANYLKHCITDDETSLRTYRGLAQVLSHQATSFSHIYPCFVPLRAKRWYLMFAFRSAVEPEQTIVLHIGLSPHYGGVRDVAGDVEAPNDLTRVVRRAVREELLQFSRPLNRALTDLERPKQLSRLTERQLTILAYLAKGYSNAQIARQLGLTLSSIKAQVALLVRMLDCKNRVQAALLGAKFGLDQDAFASTELKLPEAVPK